MIIPDTVMSMTPERWLPLLRLLQLVSPTLPVGAFAYSQGLEWAVEAGWVCDEPSLEGWLSDQLDHALVWTDLPLLLRMMDAAALASDTQMAVWIDELLALRETAELRAEEGGRGRALAELLHALGLIDCVLGAGVDAEQAAAWRTLLTRSQLAGFAFAAVAWEIEQSDGLLGYAWSWAENLTLAGVKLVPLGQTAGQRILNRLAARIPDAVDKALLVTDDEIGASTPALAIASSLHETQYTRLYRS